MAAMLSARRAFSPTLLQKLISTVRSSVAAPSATRSFITNAHDLEDDPSADLSSIPRSGIRSPAIFFVDIFNPVVPSTSLSKMKNQMGRKRKKLVSIMEREIEGGSKRGWDVKGNDDGVYVKDDDDGLYLKFHMPGLGKEDVRVTAEENILIIKSEGSEEEESWKRYNHIDLSPRVFKIDQVKAEMKNGELRVFVEGRFPG